MEKLNMKTANVADGNFRKLAALFPNAVTETINENGEVVRAVDKDVLMQEISTKVVEGREERYQFTWPDKRRAIIAANAPTTNTLRPCREESVDFDNTRNLYIEGDNLEVLKLLQENYLGKVKMIYIDPPYNTGNDFVYEDDFAESTAEYLANSGQYDEEGNRLVTNTESNGRFHTDWLNMIYPRLKVARNLLSEDGVTFISIDDNEQKNLKNVCDEVFGEGNFVAQLVWERAYSPKNDAKYISNSHDYILVYAKNIDDFHIGRLDRTEEAKEVVALFGDKGVFDGPKPVRLIQRLITLANLEDDAIVLDFFSGSASTAHALMKTNSEKDKHCQFILVQLPEEVSDTKKGQGYKNICEIGKERIRRAAGKIKEEHPDADFDGGFRVLKLDTSNMQQVYYTPEDYVAKDLFEATVDNIKPDRTAEVIAGIAKCKPYCFVMRDSGMADDSVAVNFEQLFKSYSPETILKVF